MATTVANTKAKRPQSDAPRCCCTERECRYFTILFASHYSPMPDDALDVSKMNVNPGGKQ
jgi:hypothetical protein